MRSVSATILDWREPLDVAAGFAEASFALTLLSDGGPFGRWSYLAFDPARIETLAPEDARDGLGLLREMLGSGGEQLEGGPPFQGGVAGLMAYEFGDRLEPLELSRDTDWPDLTLALYPAILAFDHHQRRVTAIGRGVDEIAANAEAQRAAAWLGWEPASRREAPPPLALAFEPDASGEAYEAAVADVVGRIAAGEIFQANIARAWGGELRPGVRPFDLFSRLVRLSPAPFAAFWRMPGLALVSHSPERFLSVGVDGESVQTRPIKGTRPRGRDAAEDAALKAELLVSAKDRAENLMIVDLMRNDLSRVCAPGSVAAPELFAVETYPAVHHLVSTVAGRLAEGRDVADLLGACFPPGSITGAPKVQAMKVIKRHEPARGPWCGSLFWAGVDGAFDSSVLIRTAALVERDGGWRFRAQAGAGIVADSDPRAERLETEAKISGLRRALTEPV
ncbi:MAG: anthranilate synthase component I family protein [Proteobacteria bacterium]|nr:anthranilate synthase component I family protein [Pseudomonadota bacterium]